MKRIVLVGGGTGGHFYPLIALAQHIRLHTEISNDISLYYFGPDPYNQEDLNRYNITYVRCPAGKRRRYFSVQNWLDNFKTIYGIFVAIRKLYVIYPDVVFSKGGYTSVPVTLAAWFLRIPVVIHESDAKPGAANKLAANFARYIAISYDDAAQYFDPERTALTGIPIRTELVERIPDAATRLGIPTDRPILFVTGGSLGAERINLLIIQSLKTLLPHFTILHQTGVEWAEKVRALAIAKYPNENDLSHYFIKGTLSAAEMNLAQNAASLIISRAGSGSIQEIAYHQKPSILIPIPEDISHDQRTNAYAYARMGAAHVLEEGNLTDSLLTNDILNILNNQEQYRAMSVAAGQFYVGDAAEKVLKILIKIANEHF
jgi:UDP-N-acetylglucosamine--N-acetylmuramyl-(pentapeptide) pyrophosphoryl-undecaprenol N-acetylglucosamine transferase